MASSKQRLLQGVGLIVLGIVFLLFNFSDLRARELWPLFLIAGGLYFYAMYFFERTNYGVLMPATILTVYGLMFLYNALGGWYEMHGLWPLFIIAPGLGFLLMYIGGKKEQGLLIPGWILTGIGTVFLLAFHESGFLLPALLILLGVVLLLSRKRGGTPAGGSGAGS